jgi:hypothetical protein
VQETDALRASRISAAFFVLSCLIVLVTHDTLGWTTILLVWLGHVWAPALYTWLAMEWGTPGWLTIAAIVVLGAAGMGPAARSAERYLQKEHESTAA